MWKCLERLFEQEKPAAVEAAKVELVEIVKRTKIIGEPVKSLADSILGMTDWVVEESARRMGYYEDVQFRHKHKELDVKFRRNYYPFSESDKYPSVVCLMDWMTPDEKEFMVETYYEYVRLTKEEAERQRQIALAAEREKFMVLVSK